MILAEITERVIGAAITVHRELGPGLLESAYQNCLRVEMSDSGIRYQHEVTIPLTYKGRSIPNSYKIDFLVEGQVIVELKTVDKLAPVHTAQVITYLRMTKCRVGLLFNFNVDVLTKGMRRIVL